MPANAPATVTEILLLEQNKTYVDVIREASANSHLNVIEDCSDVIAFLRRCGKFGSAPRPDIVLLDLELSREEDCETLTEIKKDPRFRRIPVIVLASSDSANHIYQAYDLHANAYIYKPENGVEFLKIIRATLHFWLALARLPGE